MVHNRSGLAVCSSGRKRFLLDCRICMLGQEWLMVWGGLGGVPAGVGGGKEKGVHGA